MTEPRAIHFCWPRESEALSALVRAAGIVGEVEVTVMCWSQVLGAGWMVSTTRLCGRRVEKGWVSRRKSKPWFQRRGVFIVAGITLCNKQPQHSLASNHKWLWAGWIQVLFIRFLILGPRLNLRWLVLQENLEGQQELKRSEWRRHMMPLHTCA